MLVRPRMKSLTARFIMNIFVTVCSPCVTRMANITVRLPLDVNTKAMVNTTANTMFVSLTLSAVSVGNDDDELTSHNVLLDISTSCNPDIVAVATIV